MSAETGPAPLAVEPGTVFGFRTSPIFEDSPSVTGRYGAFAVLHHDDEIAVLGALAGVWPNVPTLGDVQEHDLLTCNRFAFRNALAVFSCDVNERPKLAELVEIGQVPLTAQQTKAASRYQGNKVVGRTLSSADKVNSDIEGEWRWEHDRDAFLREHELQEQRRERARVAAKQRYETRLKDLTWEQLLSETPFSRWEPSPPFPSAKFRDAAAAQVQQTYRDMQALGAKPRKADARKLLKALVLWLNDADQAAGLVIETEEREDIWAVLEEIAHVARHPSLLDEVPDWKSW